MIQRPLPPLRPACPTCGAATCATHDLRGARYRVCDVCGWEGETARRVEVK